MTGQLERLAAAGIQIVSAGLGKHCIVERGGFVAFIERRDNEFGNIGAPGLMTDHGFAALVWRGGHGYFVGKGIEQPADSGQIEKIRAFAQDLEAAIAGGSGSARLI